MAPEAQSASIFRGATVDRLMSRRMAVVAAAILIVFIRFPGSLVAPEFWAEDGILISNAYNHGVASLFETIGGAYFNLYGSLVALLAVQAPPAAWP